MNKKHFARMETGLNSLKEFKIEPPETDVKNNDIGE